MTSRCGPSSWVALVIGACLAFSAQTPGKTQTRAPKPTMTLTVPMTSGMAMQRSTAVAGRGMPTPNVDRLATRL